LTRPSCVGTGHLLPAPFDYYRGGHLPLVPALVHVAGRCDDAAFTFPPPPPSLGSRSFCQELQDEIDELDEDDDAPECLCGWDRLEEQGRDEEAKCADRRCERFRCYKLVEGVTVELNGGRALGGRFRQPSCVYRLIEALVSPQTTGFRDGHARADPFDADDDECCQSANAGNVGLDVGVLAACAIRVAHRAPAQRRFYVDDEDYAYYSSGVGH
jgi:hypothetical protein